MDDGKVPVNDQANQTTKHWQDEQSIKCLVFWKITNCLSKESLDFTDMSANVCMLERLFARLVSVGCGRVGLD